MTPEEYDTLLNLTQITGNCLHSIVGQYVSYVPGKPPTPSVCSDLRANRVTLDGEYTSAELKALAHWMELHP
jgi:hypothetical protein